jgi:hypothetical protein
VDDVDNANFASRWLLARQKRVSAIDVDDADVRELCLATAGDVPRCVRVHAVVWGLPVGAWSSLRVPASVQALLLTPLLP